MTDALDDEFIPSKNNNYIHYRSFLSLEEAQKIDALLEQKQVPHLLDVTPRDSISSSIVGEGMKVKAVLKVLAQDFKTVDAILKEAIKQIPLSELEDHPLHDYSDNDLMDVLLKPDEWNIENITMAERILGARGKEVSSEELERLRAERLSKVRAGKSGSKFFIGVVLIAVCLDFFNSKVSFSVLGIAAGAYYLWAKNHDSSGDSYFEYDKETRAIGKIIFVGSIVFFIVKVLVYLYQNNYF